MRLPIPLRLLLAAQPKLVRPVREVVHLGGFDWSVRWYGEGSTGFSYEHTVAASLVPPIETVLACNCLEVRPAASMLGDSAEPGMRRA